MNVTDVPAQTESAEAVIVTLTESPGLTVTGKSTVFPMQLPIFGKMWYVTIPAVERVFVKTWLITNPESALNPVTVPDVKVAVQ